ncbi:hypothetical protein MMC19_006664 [Ptychographa xylographoides]|nr:hypothetical protein [Ptychographa xylographoides]
MPTYALTGSNRGLGLEFVRQLSTSETSNTIFAGVRSLSGDLSDLKALASQSKSTKIHILECDTSSLKSMQSFATEISSALGKTGKLDFLLSNAGINSVPNESSLTITPEGLAEQITVNVLGPAKTAEYLKAHLQSGSVVMNMTSGLGSVERSKGMTPRKCCTYSISKAALNMLTVHQAEDLGEGICVICMDPGWVKTRMGGEGAVLEPQESIGGMLRTIHKIGKTENGRFYTYTGEEVPW